MHNLGQTRSARRQSHMLQTPDTFIRTQIPGINKGTVIVHVSPAMGAGFTQYSVELEAGGRLEHSAYQRFLYVLEGAIALETDSQKHTLGKDGYAYLSHEAGHRITASETARVALIEKDYSVLDGVLAPAAIVANESSVAGQPVMGDPDLMVRSLLPDAPEFDFAVNTMTYQPGAALGMVEIHVMEHGLLMLEGGGIYRLNDEWYPVTAGDFIWMAPYCPQWFGALGKTPAKYLIYKDVNRHPLG